MTTNRLRGASQYIGVAVLILGALLLVVVAIDQRSGWPVLAAVAVLALAGYALGVGRHRS